MHNLRRFYYNNKSKIWKGVLIIAFVLGLIYLLDNRMIESHNSKNLYKEENSEIYEDNDKQTYISNQSAILGSIVTESDANKINQTISKFLQYCKNSNIQEAYNMLSNDCKETEYNTIEKFENKYIKNKFTKDDVFEIKSWMGNTYKVSISKDMLSTGEINSTKKIDYITIVKEENSEKLNINSYIGKKNINKEYIQNDISVNVINKNTYMDYIIYNFKIKNLSDKIIKMDTLKKAGTMYIQDLNKITYNAYAHEIFEDDIEIRSGHEIEVNIKYAQRYSDRVDIDKIVFKEVILDYIKYSKLENTENFEEICEIIINL